MDKGKLLAELERRISRQNNLASGRGKRKVVETLIKVRDMISEDVAYRFESGKLIVGDVTLSWV